MKPNMLFADRLIRTLVALTFIAVFAANVLPLAIASLMLVVSIVFLFTSFTGFCPIYWLFGNHGLKHARVK